MCNKDAWKSGPTELDETKKYFQKYIHIQQQVLSEKQKPLKTENLCFIRSMPNITDINLIDRNIQKM